LEVVLTGRNPPEEIMEMADYISEMKCLRHPYERGFPAREGVEF
jgi:cob(I)alamin adenosyltransferase